MRISFAIFMAFFSTACASVTKPAETIQISFVSAETAILEGWIISGEYSENFDQAGYKIQLKTDREITLKGKYVSVSFDFFQCDSRAADIPYVFYRPSRHPFADRDYRFTSSSNTTILKKQSDGSVLYEVELFGDSPLLKTPPICARLWVHDGNANRKIWHPRFVSNKVIVDLPQPLEP